MPNLLDNRTDTERANGPKILDMPRHVCALGAMQTVQGIHRGVPIVHAGPGCATKLAAGLAGSSGDSGYISPQIYPSSNLGEKETVFGGEGRLRETIGNALRVVDGDLYVVLSGCTAEIVGDDIGKVAAEFQAQGHPVVHVETAGFKGSSLLGHEWVISAIIAQHLVRQPVGEKRKGLVNIWGPVPSQDAFWVGNLRVLESLVAELGLTPNAVFGEQRGIGNLNRVPQAEFNLLVSPWLGLANMRELEEAFGTPYLHLPVLPIGATETSRFLREVGAYASISAETVESVIERHEREYYWHLERASDVFLENRTMSRRFSTVTNAADALAISRFLVNDFGLMPERQYITDATPVEHQQRVQALFADLRPGIGADVVFSTDGYLVHEDIRRTEWFDPPLILGSIYEKKLAEELSGNFLAISTPIKERLILNGTYLGYAGGLKMIEDIYAWVFRQFN